MKISMALGAGNSLDPAGLAKRAQDLESAGVDLVWGGEIYGYDLVSTLAYLAGKTERMQLMTGILPIYSRTPALIAQTAMTIDALSGGRFVLGLGSSGAQVIEGWHGVPFRKPLAMTRDVIEICRKVWTGGKVTHDGRVFSLPLPEGEGTGLGKPLRLMCPPPDHDIPITIAAIGPKNVQMAAEIANMWQPIHFMPDKFKDVWGDSLDAGRAKRDESLGDLEIIAGGTVALGDGPHVDAARGAVRNLTGFYVGGMGARGKNYYNDLFKRYGFVDEAIEIQDKFLGGQKGEAMAAVPDEYIDKASLTGDEGRVRERIEVYKEVGVTYLNIDVADGPEDTLTVIEKIKAWSE
ncbi:MAG: LLM class F420-dependent oxidoreductase [Actinomycetia bacterium]|nr:LLM class F420-dependent oxidoreductase [Actinomycetes bacterium]MCP4958555.1 LLM class F420-dependent oxidoreductase [Actinomycetes bacterium]